MARIGWPHSTNARIPGIDGRGPGITPPRCIAWELRGLPAGCIVHGDVLGDCAPRSHCHASFRDADEGMDESLRTTLRERRFAPATRSEGPYQLVLTKYIDIGKQPQRRVRLWLFPPLGRAHGRSGIRPGPLPRQRRGRVRGTGFLGNRSIGRGYRRECRSWSIRKRITATPLPCESWRREGTSYA